MGDKEVLFKTQEKKGRNDVSDMLHQLADKIAQGEVLLRHGEESISLQLPENLGLEVQVTCKDKAGKGKRHKLEVEIKWYEGEQGKPLEIG